MALSKYYANYDGVSIFKKNRLNVVTYEDVGGNIKRIVVRDRIHNGLCQKECHTALTLVCK